MAKPSKLSSTTLNALYNVCPLDTSRRSLRNSLHDILYKDPDFRKKSQAHTTIFGWFEDEKLSSSSTSSKLPKGTTIFKKTRLYSSTVYGPCGTVNNHSTRTTRESSPEVQQNFSFTENEQGAVIEPFVNLAEKAIYEFLVKNESVIPLEVVERFVAKQRPPVSTDFNNADLLCMLNFLIENINIFLKKSVFHGRFKANPVELLTNFKMNIRNKLAHGVVINDKGRWSDHALQHVAILACEVIICLSGNYEDASAKKETNVDPSQKRKLDETLDNIENIDTPRKKKADDSNFGEITDLTLVILGELEETEKGDKKKMLKLAMDENEYMTKFWKMLIAPRVGINRLAWKRNCDHVITNILKKCSYYIWRGVVSSGSVWEFSWKRNCDHVITNILKKCSYYIWRGVVSSGLVGLTEDKRSYLFCRYLYTVNLGEKFFTHYCAYDMTKPRERGR
ncbi:5506_t:CDS:2, partial [Cetraspora pellucida]